MQIAGNAFLITGGASGLGAACARRLVAAGGKVALLDLNAAAGAALAGELGPSAQLFVTDVTNESSAQAAVQAACACFGAVRGLVSCAGVLGAARVVGREGPHDLALFRKVIEVNLIGVFNVLRLAAAAMGRNEPLATGERGVIVNTSSVAALDGQIGQAAYAASKGGVAALSLPAARELAKLGIRVLAIAPGVMETPMMTAAPAAVRDSLAAQVPFPPRLGLPDEFAQLVQQAVENPYLNGCLLRLDGALRMGPK